MWRGLLILAAFGIQVLRAGVSQTLEPEQAASNLPNVLFNPLFLDAKDLLPDSYSGRPAERGGPLPPGWTLEGKARVKIDKTVCYSMPRSLRIEEVGLVAAVMSLPCRVYGTKAAFGTAKVLVRGEPTSCRLVLRWTLRNGSFAVTRSAPASKQNNFVSLKITAPAPDGAQWVSLGIACSSGAGTVFFDDPRLVFLDERIEIFTPPLGCRPGGLREAVIRSRLPLAQPYARARSGEKSRAVRVEPFKVHPSGFFYYIADLYVLTEPGAYTLIAVDTAVPDRRTSASFRLSPDPYRSVEREALDFIRKHLTRDRLSKMPPGRAARRVLALAYGCRAGLKARDILRSSAAMLRKYASLKPEGRSGAFCAWALASAGRELGDRSLCAASRSILHPCWEKRDRSDLLETSALCGAAAVLSGLGGEVFDRDIADDTVREIAAEQDPYGCFPLSEQEEKAFWPVLAAAEYLASIPSSNVRPIARAVLDKNLMLHERLASVAPFGQTAVPLEGGTTLEVPAWNQGNTVYLLAGAAVLLFSGTVAPSEGLSYYAERQVQFLYGYNPLGKRLNWREGEALRSASGKYYRPGALLLTNSADPMKTALYLGWTCAALRKGNSEAKISGAQAEGRKR